MEFGDVVAGDRSAVAAVRVADLMRCEGLLEEGTDRSRVGRVKSGGCGAGLTPAGVFREDLAASEESVQGFHRIVRIV